MPQLILAQLLKVTPIAGKTIDPLVGEGIYDAEDMLINASISEEIMNLTVTEGGHKVHHWAPESQSSDLVEKLPRTLLKQIDQEHDVKTFVDAETKKVEISSGGGANLELVIKKLDNLCRFYVSFESTHMPRSG